MVQAVKVRMWEDRRKTHAAFFKLGNFIDELGGPPDDMTTPTMQCPSISLPGICAGVIGVFALISIGISSWQFQDHDLEHDLFFKCKDGYARRKSPICF